ncbi:hypothetical protein TIFTF001_036107 [Ficus carica]|uniref:Uncharacterized protein n=1 Tax=Ficus carica TaxID=3494 RepID=A0AA88JCF4_FICCA|nr:hypothetical protein TIFTF001_036107 [Ficus carica]
MLTGPSGRATPAARQNPGPCNRANELEHEHIVHTIFGGTATGDTASSRRSYALEARRFARGEYINMAEHISKIRCQDSTPITFTDDEADRLLHPHNDALIGEIRVADNVVRRVLIDNGSLADIMFMDAFSRLKIEGAVLTPAQTPLYGQLLWFPDHGVRSHDQASTRIRHVRAGPKTPAFADNSCGSRTTELGLTTGHRPELDVPEQDSKHLPSQATPVVPGPWS